MLKEECEVRPKESLMASAASCGGSRLGGPERKARAALPFQERGQEPHS
jgi:hypothetical protein